MKRGAWGAVLKAGWRLLKLIDFVRHGACLACLWAYGYIAYICIYINKDNSGFSKAFNYFYFKAKNKLNGTVYYGERSFGYNGTIIFCGYF